MSTRKQFPGTRNDSNSGFGNKSSTKKEDNLKKKASVLNPVYSETFQRTDRAVDIHTKALKLCDELNAKKKKEDEQNNGDQVFHEPFPEFTPLPKKQVKFSLSTGKSRAVKDLYDSVFMDDTESSWSQSLRKLDKKMLSPRNSKGSYMEINSEKSTTACRKPTLDIGDTDTCNSMMAAATNSLEPTENIISNNFSKDDASLPPITPYVSQLGSSNNSVSSSKQESISLKYFGAAAKPLFYQTYHELARQSNIMLNAADDLMEGLKMNKVRPMTQRLALNGVGTEESDDDDETQMTATVSRTSGVAPKHSPARDSDSSASPSDCANDNDSIGGSSFVSSMTQSSVSKSSKKMPPHFHNFDLDDEEDDDDFDLDYKAIGQNGISGDESVIAASVTSRSSTYNPASPRAKFLAGCLKHKIAPRSSIMLRSKVSTELLLDHQGMGDRLGILLASGLNDMPFVETLSLAENNLTDISLQPLIESIALSTSITDLDISDNVIGPEASNALGIYLGSPSCPLKKLHLCHADVDDSECCRMVTSLRLNKNLEELDLSRNLLGKDETLNTVRPDVTTGGECLANYLREGGGGSLRVLKVPWNMIRLDSAKQLCESLSFATKLIHLDLSYNTLGNEAGIMLGSSLLDNKVLEELLLANNDIGPSGCFCICVAMRENTTLKHLCLDGNVLGEAGARALMTLPLVRGENVHVSTKGCNFTLKDERCWWSPLQLERSFTLDMSSVYDRAVMLDLLYVLSEKTKYAISPIDYDESGRGGAVERVKLYRYFSKICIRSQQDTVAYERQLRIRQLAEDKSDIAALFQSGVSHSGGRHIDKRGFAEIVQGLHGSILPRKVASLFDMFDSHRSGDLDLEEFTDYMNMCGADASIAIELMETEPIMCECRDAGGNLTSRYVPPTRGILKFHVRNLRWKGQFRPAATPVQMERISAMANLSSDRFTLMSYAVEATEFHLPEAMTMFERLLVDNGNAVSVLAIMLPHMATMKEAKYLEELTLGDDITLQRILKKKMGNLYPPMTGNVTGFFTLDFRRKIDQECMERLLEISNDATYYRKSRGLGDISQDGNWSCFRNVVFNGTPSTIDASNYEGIPESGKAEFDFVDTKRSLRYDSMRALQDHVFLDTLVRLQLLGVSRLPWAKKRLSTMRTAMDKVMYHVGTHYWTCSNERAEAYGRYIRCVFYKCLPERSAQMEAALKRESDLGGSIKTDLETMFSESAPHTAKKSGAKKRTDKRPAELRNTHSMKEKMHHSRPDTVSRGASSCDDWDTSEEVMMEDERSPLLKREVKEMKRMDRKIDRFVSILSKFSSDFRNANAAVTANIVQFLHTLFWPIWLRARQLMLLVECFVGAHEKRTDFGSYAADLVIGLFPRVKDMHNFELVLSVMSPEDQGALSARLGFLALFNPIKPEGSIRLDLSRWEQRQVTKLILHLALDEPGENWVDETYSSHPEEPPMPGWKCSVVWFSEDGLPRMGLLTSNYCSGNGTSTDGFSPNVDLRYTLLSAVLVRPSEIAPEACDPTWRGREDTVTLKEANALIKETGDKNITWTYDYKFTSNYIRPVTSMTNSDK